MFIFNLQKKRNLKKHPRISRVSRSNEGFFIVSAVFLAFLGSAYLFSSYHSLRHTQKSVSRTLSGQELSNYKDAFYAEADCATSMTSSTCPSSHFLSLKAFDGSEIISPSGTTHAPYTFRAECNERNDGIMIRAAKLKLGATVHSTQPQEFFKDPSTGTAFDWNYSRGVIYDEDTALCSPRNPGIVRTPASSTIFQDYSRLAGSDIRKNRTHDISKLFQSDNRFGFPWGSIQDEGRANFFSECDRRRTECPSGISYPMQWGGYGFCTCL